MPSATSEALGGCCSCPCAPGTTNAAAMIATAIGHIECLRVLVMNAVYSITRTSRSLPLRALEGKRPPDHQTRAHRCFRTCAVPWRYAQLRYDAGPRIHSKRDQTGRSASPVTPDKDSLAEKGQSLFTTVPEFHLVFRLRGTRRSDGV